MSSGTPGGEHEHCILDVQVAGAHITLVEPGVFKLTSGDITMFVNDLTVDDAAFVALEATRPLTTQEREEVLGLIEAARDAFG